MTETWELWFPDAGATGLLFTRTKVDADHAGDRVLVHAPATALEVVVRDEKDNVVARAEKLERTEQGPMAWLVRDGDTITLEQGWPSEDDLGRLVLLPGGESGVLKAWWHAKDKSEWRWQVEFYNHT